MSVCPRKFDKILKWPRPHTAVTPRPCNCLLIAFYEPAPSLCLRLPFCLRCFTLPPPGAFYSWRKLELPWSTQAMLAAPPAPAPAPAAAASCPAATPCQLRLQLGFATDLIWWKYQKFEQISMSFPIAAHAQFWVIARSRAGQGGAAGSWQLGQRAGSRSSWIYDLHFAIGAFVIY